LKLASFYRLYSKWAEVEATLQKLAALKAARRNAAHPLGRFLYLLGQQDKALASYQRATEVNPGSVIARDKLISHYLDTGKTSEAESKGQRHPRKEQQRLDGALLRRENASGQREPDEAFPSSREW